MIVSTRNQIACSCCPASHRQTPRKTSFYCIGLRPPKAFCKAVKDRLPAFNGSTLLPWQATHTCLQIVGITSSCLDADSSGKAASQVSAAALRQELEWGIHLGLQACLLPLPPRLGNANFAHVINQVHLARQSLGARCSYLSLC